MRGFVRPQKESLFPNWGAEMETLPAAGQSSPQGEYSYYIRDPLSTAGTEAHKGRYNPWDMWTPACSILHFYHL